MKLGNLSLQEGITLMVVGVLVASFLLVVVGVLFFGASASNPIVLTVVSLFSGLIGGGGVAAVNTAAVKRQEQMMALASTRAQNELTLYQAREIVARDRNTLNKSSVRMGAGSSAGQVAAGTNIRQDTLTESLRTKMGVS